MDEFTPTTEDEVRKIILSSPSKSCSLDPIPTWLLKLCLDETVPIITRIINLSFSSANMPSSLKTGIITPLLKKLILELILKNYRPVSNLPFLSKVTEKVVKKRLVAHQNENGLKEVMQSAYSEHHSTETALLKVQSDILAAMDKQQVVLLVLLDLSAAFDTIDHKILLNRLSDRCGIKGKALAWLNSYLTNREQYVTVNGHSSKTHPLEFGVPQGSVLGPILFCLYASPLGDVVRKYGLLFHCYADDNQLYLCFTPYDQTSADVSVEQLSICAQEVNTFLVQNLMKNNSDKTEFMVIGTRQQLSKIDIPFIDIGDSQIVPCAQVKNLGVMFDQHMTMEQQTRAVSKSAHYHLRNIRMIRPFLDIESAEAAIHAFVTSRLDGANSLLYGINKREINRLQLCQNMAACVLMGKRKFDHITEVRKSLHWLPVQQRIEYKVLCLAYKALHGTAPVYLTEMLNKHEPLRELRSANKLLLKVPSTNLVTCGDRCFSKSAPTLWNRLPLTIRSAESLDTFKRRLKTYLFHIAY